MNKLKPCPCCGGNAVLEIGKNTNEIMPKFFAKCTKCGMSSLKDASVEMVTEIWNFRSGEDKGKNYAELMAQRCFKMILDALENLSIDDINMWNVGHDKGKTEALEWISEFRQWITDEQWILNGMTVVPSNEIFDLIDFLVEKIKEGEESNEK